jgi:hypothetical protein
MINVVFKNLISWLDESKMSIVMCEFENWCGLPNIRGAIDETHIAIFKPFDPFAKDYYYHKSGGYCVVTQTMVDCDKQFIDLFVGFLGSVNDS